MIYGFNEKKEKVAISEEGYQFVEKDNDGNVDITGDLDVGGDVSVDGGLTASAVNGKDVSKFLTRAEFSVVPFTVPAVNVAANTDSGSKTYTVTKEGYYPLAIADFNVTGTNRMYQNLYTLKLGSYQSSGTAEIIYRFRNNASAPVSIGLEGHILWVKIL